MKKIPTIFERDWNGDRSKVVNQPHRDCAWVFNGERLATQKLDGTCCMVRDGRLFRRRELKAGQTTPAGFESEGADAETGKTVGWVPVGEGPEDAIHREAFSVTLADGTYELVGPKVQSNPENYDRHRLVPHSSLTMAEQPPRDFSGLAAWLLVGTSKASCSTIRTDVWQRSSCETSV